MAIAQRRQGCDWSPTDRLVVRLANERDDYRLAEYYAANRDYLKPWEPIRDESHCYPSGWQARLLSCLIRWKRKSAAWRILVMCYAAHFMRVFSAVR